MKDKHLGTILVFVLVFIILFLIYERNWMLTTAIILGCVGLFIPWLSRKIHALWMGFAEILGSVMNKVILSVVFFVFLTPVAFLKRLFRGNSMKKSRQASFYTERSITYDKKSLEDLW